MTINLIDINIIEGEGEEGGTEAWGARSGQTGQGKLDMKASNLYLETRGGGAGHAEDFTRNARFCGVEEACGFSVSVLKKRAGEELMRTERTGRSNKD